MKAKRPICLVCKDEIFGPVIYCPHCGGNQEALAAYFLALEEKERVAKELEEKKLREQREEQQTKPPTPKPQNQSQTPPKIKSKRGKAPLVAVAVVVAGAGAIFIGSNSSNPQASSSTTQAEQKIIVQFTDIAGEIATYNAATRTCNLLGKAVLNPDFLPRSAEDIGFELDKVRNKSSATKYLESNQAWMRESLLAQFESYLRQKTDPSLRELITELGYGATEYSIDFNTWSVSFSELAIESCDLSAQLSETEDNIRQFQKDVDRVNALAE